MKKSKLLNPVFLSAALVLTSFAARKGTATVWEAVADEPPPAENLQHSVSFREAAAWAVISGAIVGLARVAVRRFLATHETFPKDLGKKQEEIAPFV